MDSICGHSMNTSDENFLQHQLGVSRLSVSPGDMSQSKPCSSKHSLKGTSILKKKRIKPLKIVERFERFCKSLGTDSDKDYITDSLTSATNNVELHVPSTITRPVDEEKQSFVPAEDQEFSRPSDLVVDNGTISNNEPVTTQVICNAPVTSSSEQCPFFDVQLDISNGNNPIFSLGDIAQSSPLKQYQENSLLENEIPEVPDVLTSNDPGVPDPVAFETTVESSSLKCPTCLKDFKHKRSLTRHMRLHDGTGVNCTMCGKIFSDQDTFNRHKQSVHEGNILQCQICAKTYKTKGGLHTHMKCHRGDYKHLCPFCGKRFQYKTYFDFHITKHTNQKLHCTRCNMQFTHTSNLSRHMETCGETQQKYSCSFCPSKFKSRRYAKEHETVKHINPERLQCSTCGERFGHRSSLSKHKKTKHP